MPQRPLPPAPPREPLFSPLLFLTPPPAQTPSTVPCSAGKIWNGGVCFCQSFFSPPLSSLSAWRCHYFSSASLVTAASSRLSTKTTPPQKKPTHKTHVFPPSPALCRPQLFLTSFWLKKISSGARDVGGMLVYSLHCINWGTEQTWVKQLCLKKKKKRGSVCAGEVSQGKEHILPFQRDPYLVLGSVGWVSYNLQ